MIPQPITFSLRYLTVMLHPEILNSAQQELLPLVGKFGREYYLVGGTAIALYLGHRRSIDYDLFKKARLQRKKNLDVIQASGYSYQVLFNTDGQMNLVVNGVKLTFFQYEFDVKPVSDFQGVVKLPSLLDLAAMKAYALGRRSKWKDYVDLYFLLKEHFSIDEISARAEIIFGELFSTKMFRVQLSYFEDVDYSEEVEYLVPNPPSNLDIQTFLTEVSTEILG